MITTTDGTTISFVLGCGMHVASALKGVAEEDRCPNWKKGSRQPCTGTTTTGGETTATTGGEGGGEVRSAWMPPSWFS